jgi:hypothetical protein
MPPDHEVLLGLNPPIVGREAYVRRIGLGMDGYEESPFRSVFHSMWYVLMTFTTVGYGDVVPTTVEAMVMFIFCITTGVTLLALPIGVIGQCFNEEFDKMNMERLQRDKSMMKRRRKDKYTRFGMRPVVVENAGFFKAIATDAEIPDALRDNAIPCSELRDAVVAADDNAGHSGLAAFVDSLGTASRALSGLSRRVATTDVASAAFVQRETIRNLLSQCDKRV